MKKKVFKCLCLSLCLTAVLGGCSRGTISDSGAVKKELPDTYPLETNVELRYWSGSQMADGDQFHLYLQEETGVKVNFEGPADTSSAAQAFNLMLTQEELPDIMFAGWKNLNGGPDNSLEQGVLTDLTPYIEAGMAPNFKKYLDEHPELKKECTSSNGKFYYFPKILGDERMSNTRVWFIRKDLLDKVNLEMPETIDEWENVLRAFKKIGIKRPLMMKLTNYWLEYDSPFTACFDFAGYFYHDKQGKIKFGPYEDKFEKWVETMARWYKEGLLDIDFADESNTRWAAAVTNGENGAYLGTLGGNYGTYTEAMPADSTIEYVAIKFPTSTKGKDAMYASKEFMVDPQGAGVAATCKNKEVAIRFLDYGYSEAGQRLWNFGREGITYDMVENENGEMIPTYKEFMLKPDTKKGLSSGQVRALYTRAGAPVSIQNLNYMLQIYNYPEQQRALMEIASNTDTLDYKLHFGICDADQEKRLSDIMSPINTYREETIIKIIAGALPLETMNEYYEKLKQLGIEEAINIYQEAYNRFSEK